MAEETTDNAEEAATPADADAGAGAEAATPADAGAAAAAGSEAPHGAATGAPAASTPQEVLTPKERRQRRRAVRSARVGTRAPRTAEERQADRRAERAQKAQARRAQRAKDRSKPAAGPSGEPTAPREHAPGTQKVRQGIVVSDKADKTITVRIDVARRHRRYQKVVRTSQTLHAHDESNDAHTGDTVTIRECRPLSRTKRWRLVEVVERAR